MSSSERCPTCGRPFDKAVTKRICCLCKQPILQRHKWFINRQGKLQHRFCSKPEAYNWELGK